MKKILYLAISVNGYIAKKNNDTPWSNTEWQSWIGEVKKAGNLIIGRKTFDLMTTKHISEIGNPFMVVLSNNPLQTGDNVKCANSPQDAINIIESEGFEIAFIGGGGTTATSFMNANLIDELLVDIEPKIFDEGLPFFNKLSRDINLQLIETKKYDDNGIKLHYKIIKND